jgi:hypothetical protein
MSTVIMIVTLYRGLYPVPMSTDFITFQRLENLYVATAAKPQSHFHGCAANGSLQNFSMASLSLYIPTEVSPLEKLSIELWRYPLVPCRSEE